MMVYFFVVYPNPSLNQKFCHQKVIQWSWVLRHCHFFEQDWRREDPRPYWWPSFPVTFKYLVQRPSKGMILAKTMTQFSIYVELSSISLQLSGLSWINNRWSPPGISAGCSNIFFLLIIKTWTWKWRCILLFSFIVESNRLLNGSGV